MQNFLKTIADSMNRNVVEPARQTANAAEAAMNQSVHQVVQSATNGINRAGEIAYDINTKGNQLIQPIIDKILGTPAYDNKWAKYQPKPDLHLSGQNVAGYRADPHGKFGGKDGLETQPTELPADDIYKRVRALAMAKKFGVPQLTAQELTALALKEGKYNFGSLVPDPNHKSEIFDKMQEDGADSAQAQFVALVAEKKAVAKRLGIPFAEAWNGTGRSYMDKNTTGADYARNYTNHYMKAAMHPKNKQLYNLIQSALDTKE